MNVALYFCELSYGLTSRKSLLLSTYEVHIYIKNIHQGT